MTSAPSHADDANVVLPTGSVLMLAGDDAGWITGQTIIANGENALSL